MLDNNLRLSSGQQAQWVAKLHEVEFHESDLSSDWLGVGLWIAYAALALLWCRSVAWRGKSSSVRTVRGPVAAPQVARQRAGSLESQTQFGRPRARLFPEPSAAQI